MATISIYTRSQYLRVVDPNDDRLHRIYRSEPDSGHPIKSILLCGAESAIEIGEVYVREVFKQSELAQCAQMLGWLRSLNGVTIYFSTGDAVWDAPETPSADKPPTAGVWVQGDAARTMVVTSDTGEAKIAIRAIRHCHQVAESPMVDVMLQLNRMGVFSDNPDPDGVTYFEE